MKSISFLSRPTRQRGLLFVSVSLFTLVALSLIGSAPAARGQKADTRGTSDAVAVIAVKANDRSASVAGKSARGARFRALWSVSSADLHGQTLPSMPNRAAGPDLIGSRHLRVHSAAGVALEDMSSGTTQLVAPCQDDTASAVTNIGFDYWYDGVPTSQFSVNANGLIRLGPTVVSTSFTTPWARQHRTPRRSRRTRTTCVPAATARCTTRSSALRRIASSSSSGRT